MTSKLSNTQVKGLRLAAILSVVLSLGACAVTEGGADNPVLRKFQWFSYMEGGDFRDTCKDGGANRYRMIYNAVYTEQVRIYELSPRASMLHTQVMLPMDLRDFQVDSLAGLLDPWRGVEADTVLSASDLNGALADLVASGAFGPPNVGAELSSKGFFWTIASCHDGAYHFTGFPWPSPQWDQARFAETLFALDRTGVAVNPPRTTDTSRLHKYEEKVPRRKVQQYQQKVGEHGLAGIGPLF